MSKKVWAVFLAVMLLMLAAAPAALANPIGNKYVKTSSGKSVRMRGGPGTEYDVIDRVPNGASVETYSQMQNPAGERWTEIGYHGATGWIMSRYLSGKKPGSQSGGSSSKDSGSGTMTATIFTNFHDVALTADIKPSTPGNFVNLRWAPSKSAPVQARYYEGQQVYVLKANNSWCQVYDEANNRCGFILRSLLDY